MNPAVAGLLGGGVAAGYIPFLRRQIRDGEVNIPFGTINPVRLRRDEHPLAFRLCAIALAMGVGLLIGIGVLLVAQAAWGTSFLSTGIRP